MTPQDALYLVAEIKKIDYRKRITKLAQADWDFTNSIEWWAKQGRTLTPKQSYRLQEIYRRAAGHYKKFYPKAVSILLLCLILQGFGIETSSAQELTASYYSVKSLKTEGTWKRSQGRMANGEVFDENKLTCAVYGYEFGQILRVTNLQSGRRVHVKVTDRIAKRFAKTRIDLSRQAFGYLSNEQYSQGLLQVKVEVVR